MSHDWKQYLTGADRDAAASTIRLFESYGLGSLAPKIVEYIQQGFSGDTLALLLQDTSEYEERFKGNQLREQAGLPVLSPADYLRTEEGYRRALRESGMPVGFYDKPEDFNKFIGLDVAPEEIRKRADRARELVNTIDPLQRAVLQRRTGLTIDDMASYYLDVSVAQPILERRIETTLLGAERERAGFDYSQTAAELLYSQGLSLAQARAGYGRIAETLPDYARLAEIEGDQLTVSDLEEAVFGQSGEQQRRLQSLTAREEARFAGRAGLEPSRALARNLRETQV